MLLERLRQTLATDIKTLRGSALALRQAGLTAWADLLESEADAFQKTLATLDKA